ncbi:MAG: hypothetical protein ABJA66_11465 [Actinomycetota bacterium]
MKRAPESANQQSGAGFFFGSITWILIEVLGVPIYAVFACWVCENRLVFGGRLGFISCLGYCFAGFFNCICAALVIGGCLDFNVLAAAYIGLRELKK